MVFKSVSQPASKSNSRTSSRASSPVAQSSPIPPIRKEASTHRPVPPLPAVASGNNPLAHVEQVKKEVKIVEHSKQVGIKSLSNKLEAIEKSVKELQERPHCSCSAVESKMNHQIQIVGKQLDALKFDLKSLIDG
jgi:hypothetical protein